MMTHLIPSSVGPFCGNKLPSTIQTKGNRLMIRFHSDPFIEAKGFRAYWTTDPTLPAPTEPPVLPNPWDDIPIGKASALTPYSICHDQVVSSVKTVSVFNIKTYQILCILKIYLI